MKKIVFVSSNSGKRAAVMKYAKEKDIDVDFYSMELEELEVNDIEAISRQKASDAFSHLGIPCFVSDTGFYIDNYPDNPGYPGAFAKRSGVSSNIIGLLDKMKAVENRNCHFLDCLTFYDGSDFYTFYSATDGILARSSRGTNMGHAKSNLWKVFIPEGEVKTLAEMSEDEFSNFTKKKPKSATLQFFEWYIENVNQNENKVFIKNNK